ncbi:CFI-box-CTERM domain-containing protein [Leucobacter sp. cx-169]|nr:CFI-box-CTERM domain-containing protein [Leucobacter sp. cx-169]MBC9927405.1 hypothetical protein [Leucobacter sp. cx-169]
MKIIAIAAGKDHALALTEWGTVISWGNAPEAPEGLGNVKSIAAGAHTSLALLDDGTVVGWGATAVPQGLSGVVQVLAGGSYCFAVLDDGHVVGWKKMSFFDPAVEDRWDFENPPASVSKSGGFALALDPHGRVSIHELGGFLHGLAPEVPEALQTGIVQVAGGFAHGLTLSDKGVVATWGEEKQLSSSDLGVPLDLCNVKAIAAGGAFSLALREDGTVAAWGYNDFGQTDIPEGLHGVTAVAAGTHFALALCADGKVVAWGRKDHNQSQVPTEIAGESALSAESGDLRPIVLNRELRPTFLISSGAPHEKTEMTLTQVPNGETAMRKVKQLSSLLELASRSPHYFAEQHDYGRDLGIAWNNYAARKILEGDYSGVLDAFSEADRAFREIPSSPAEDGKRHWELLECLPISRAVLRVNIAIALLKLDQPEQIPQFLSEARGLLREGPSDWITLVTAAVSKIEEVTEERLNPSSQPPTPSQSADGGCYIATAVYGSYEAPEVLSLRAFRDQHLLTNASGRLLVRIYYCISPSLASLLHNRSALNKAARRFLDGIVRRISSPAASD